MVKKHLIGQRVSNMADSQMKVNNKGWQQ